MATAGPVGVARRFPRCAETALLRGCYQSACFLRGDVRHGINPRVSVATCHSRLLFKGSSFGNDIVLFDPFEHHNIADGASNQLDYVLLDRVPQELAHVAACNCGKLRGCTTVTLMTGLCHTVVIF